MKKLLICLILFLCLCSCSVVNNSSIFYEFCNDINTPLKAMHKIHKLHYERTKFPYDVYITPEKTLQLNKGNCLSFSILFLAVCEYKGWGKGQMYNLQDVNKKEGHMIVLLNNYLYDCGTDCNPHISNNYIIYENWNEYNWFIFAIYDYNYVMIKAENDTNIYDKELK